MKSKIQLHNQIKPNSFKKQSSHTHQRQPKLQNYKITKSQNQHLFLFVKKQNHIFNFSTCINPQINQNKTETKYTSWPAHFRWSKPPKFSRSSTTTTTYFSQMKIRWGRRRRRWDYKRGKVWAHKTRMELNLPKKTARMKKEWVRERKEKLWVWAFGIGFTRFFL